MKILIVFLAALLFSVSARAATGPGGNLQFYQSGVGKGQATKANFVGASVSVVNGTATITITSGGGSATNAVSSAYTNNVAVGSAVTEMETTNTFLIFANARLVGSRVVFSFTLSTTITNRLALLEAMTNTLGTLISARQGGSANLTNWSLFSTNVLADVASNGVVVLPGSNITITQTHTNNTTYYKVAGSAGAGTGDFLADGTVPMTGPLDLNGQNINNVDEATVSSLHVGSANSIDTAGDVIVGGDLVVAGSATFGKLVIGQEVVVSNTVQFATTSYVKADLNTSGSIYKLTNALTGNMIFAVTNLAGTTNSNVHFRFSADGSDRYVTNSFNSIGNTIPVLLHNGSATAVVSPLVWKVPANTIVEGDVDFGFLNGTNHGIALTNIITL